MIFRIIDKATLFFIRDDFTFDKTTEIALDVAPAQGFYRPVWDGGKWVEGCTQTEIDAINAAAIPAKPTIDERVSEVETDVDDIITVLAVIEGVSV